VTDQLLKKLWDDWKTSDKNLTDEQRQAVEFAALKNQDSEFGVTWAAAIIGFRSYAAGFFQGIKEGAGETAGNS
jgi:hypothetical protein